MMIPISRSQKLSHTIGGVKYLFNPYAGDTEVAIYNIMEEAGLIKDAEDEEKNEKNILDKVKTWFHNVKLIDRIIDVSMCGWEAEDPAIADKLPPFPDGIEEKPHQMLNMGIKSPLVNWYLKGIELDKLEVKN